MNRAYLLLAFLVSACATSEPANHAALQSEVTASLHEGTSSTYAIEVLTLSGFSCAEGTILDRNRKGIFECTRSRGSIWPPYGCVHRIWFEAESPDGPISNLEVLKPFCASL